MTVSSKVFGGSTFFGIKANGSNRSTNGSLVLSLMGNLDAFGVMLPAFALSESFVFIFIAVGFTVVDFGVAEPEIGLVASSLVVQLESVRFVWSLSVFYFERIRSPF